MSVQHLVTATIFQTCWSLPLYDCPDLAHLLFLMLNIVWKCCGYEFFPVLPTISVKRDLTLYAQLSNDLQKQQQVQLWCHCGSLIPGNKKLASNQGCFTGAKPIEKHIFLTEYLLCSVHQSCNRTEKVAIIGDSV